MIGMKLHLGCGGFILPKPWVNIDSRYQPGVDSVDNIGILRRYEPDSVEEIYCCHALDHFSRWDYPRVLKRWHEMLKPGGRLRISTVDFEAVACEYSNGCSLSNLIGALYAAQDYESNCRKMIWDSELLHRDLGDAGFREWSRYVSDINDCSNATLPSGRRLSLNVEAFK